MQSSKAGAIESVSEIDGKSKYKIRRSHDNEGLISTERTSLTSFRTTNSGRKKQTPIIEPEPQTTLSTAFELISTPVKYITSVFYQPVAEVLKSPPRPKYKYPEAPKTKKYSRPSKPAQAIPATVSNSIAQLKALPPPAPITDSMEVIRVDLAKSVENKMRALAVKPAEKKSDTIPPRSHVMKSKPQEPFVKSASSSSKKRSPSPARKNQPTPPRLLSASAIKVASSNNLSYRVTSTEKVDVPAKPKKLPSKKYKIDREKI
jgi:hypothetical protein